MTDFNFSNYTVLVVDDVKLNLVLVEKMLKRYDLQVLTATSGVEALSIIESNRPSAVLLDLMMPNMDGFEVLNRIRKNPDTANLPVVILSALNSESDIKRCEQLGANDYITKPIIITRLVEVLKKVLTE